MQLHESFQIHGLWKERLTSRSLTEIVLHLFAVNLINLMWKQQQEKSHLIRNAYNLFTYTIYNCCFLVSQSCPTLRDSWAATHHALLSFTISWSLLKFMSIESVMPSNHLILCHPLLLLPSIFPSIRVFLIEDPVSSYQVAQVLEFQLQHHSFQWIFRVDFP